MRLGWNTFEKAGMKDVIGTDTPQGAVLVGMSAGPVQLGRYAIAEAPQSVETELFDVFGFVPVVIGMHDERAEKERLSHTVEVLEGAATGLGIPSGGGIIAHADATIEPLRHPAQEFRYEDNRVVHSLLCPGNSNPQRMELLGECRGDEAPQQVLLARPVARRPVGERHDYAHDPLRSLGIVVGDSGEFGREMP